jgi:hypothetical protein
MRYTNNRGLSNAIAKAIVAFNEDYDKVGWKSVTTLIDSPRAQLLRERHNDEITEDVSDLIWSFFGNMGHLIAERHPGRDVLAEQRFIHKVLGKEISLKPDRLEKDIGSVPITWTLRDFKITSVWVLKACMEGRIKEEWEKQMNLYVYLLEQLGFPISSIKLEVIGRDWRESERRQSPWNYPPTQADVFDVPIWSRKHQETYINERIKLYEQCEALADDDLPKCSMSERWADPDTWAVVKKSTTPSKQTGYRKALPKAGYFKSNTEAMNFIKAKRRPKVNPKIKSKYSTVKKAVLKARADADDLMVEFRKAESRRCERGYCKAAPFCNQFKTEIKPVF